MIFFFLRSQLNPSIILWWFSLPVLTWTTHAWKLEVKVEGFCQPLAFPALWGQQQGGCGGWGASLAYGSFQISVLSGESPYLILAAGSPAAPHSSLWEIGSRVAVSSIMG